MSHFATIAGHVTYMPGDGTPIEIPHGRVEVELAFDSATLSWEQSNDVVGLTAIPRSQYDDCIADGSIVLEQQQAA